MCSLDDHLFPVRDFSTPGGEGGLRVNYSDLSFVSSFEPILNLEELFSEGRKRAGTARKTSNLPRGFTGLFQVRRMFLNFSLFDPRLVHPDPGSDKDWITWGPSAAEPLRPERLPLSGPVSIED